MTPEQFTNQYCGEFSISERDMALAIAAMKYHDICNSFDFLACTGRGPDGEPWPATPYERGMVSRNAQNVRRELLAGIQHLGITSTELKRAISRTERKRREGHNCDSA